MPKDNNEFSTGDYVVYPSHGVGRILALETQQIAGYDLKVFVISFEKDRMTLRLPIGKARAAGLRKLSTPTEMKAALTRLKGRTRARRTMWSRRAQEYEAKINSGDPASIAEVVRDLYRNTGQADQSYSERQIFQAAMDRLVREFAASRRSTRRPRPRSSRSSFRRPDAAAGQREVRASPPLRAHLGHRLDSW